MVAGYLMDQSPHHLPASMRCLLAAPVRSDTLLGMEDDQLERYLELCKRMYERMQRDGSWPWADSQDSDDVVESKDKSKNV